MIKANKKGEILTILTLLSLITTVLVSITTTFIMKSRQTIKTKASSPGTCVQYPPIEPPSGDNTKEIYYYWEADCDKLCHQNSDCPQNTTDPVVPANLSNWCYGFEGPLGTWDDWRCLMLKSCMGKGCNNKSSESSTTNSGLQTTNVNSTSNSSEKNSSGQISTPTSTPTPQCQKVNVRNYCSVLYEEFTFKNGWCCPLGVEPPTNTPTPRLTETPTRQPNNTSTPIPTNTPKPTLPTANLPSTASPSLIIENTNPNNNIYIDSISIGSSKTISQSLLPGKAYVYDYGSLCNSNIDNQKLTGYFSYRSSEDSYKYSKLIKLVNLSCDGYLLIGID